MSIYLEELNKKRAEYKAKYDGYATKTLADGTEAKNIPANDVEGLQALMAEVNDLGAKHEMAEKADQLSADIEAKSIIDRTPVNRGGMASTPEQKSFAQAVLESDQYKGRVGAKMADLILDLDMKTMLGLEQKTVMTTSAGFAPFIVRDGKIVPAISRPPQFLDYLRIEPVTANAVKFMKQTTRTNAAAGKAEGSALAESAIAYTEATVAIEKIGTFLPITEEQWEDATEVQNIIENDLRLMVRQILDSNVTVGNGTPPNLRGAYNATGALTQAAGTDNIFDQIMKAINNGRVNGRVSPNLVVLHTDNYQTLALTKTADGVYLYGNPADAPLSRVWGINIALSEALTTGTGMVVDTDYLRLKLRKDVTIAVADQHDTDFTKNQLTLRAHTRAGLQIVRDEAVVKLTGMS